MPPTLKGSPAMKKLCAVACLSLAFLSLDVRPAAAWGCCGCGCYKTKCCQYNAFSPFCCDCCCAPCGPCGLGCCCRPMAFTPYCPPPCPYDCGGCTGGSCYGGCQSMLPAAPAAPTAGPSVPAAPGVASTMPTPAAAPVPMHAAPQMMPYPIYQPTSYVRPGYGAPTYGAPVYGPPMMGPAMPYGMPMGARY